MKEKGIIRIKCKRILKERKKESKIPDNESENKKQKSRSVREKKQ